MRISVCHWEVPLCMRQHHSEEVSIAALTFTLLGTDISTHEDKTVELRTLLRSLPIYI